MDGWLGGWMDGWMKALITHKHLEMNGCMLSTVDTDALVLKHQAISIYSADYILIVLDHI